jgi:nicotinamide phosphoribosyltransferase
MALNKRHNICRDTDFYKITQVGLDPVDVEYIMEYTMARKDRVQFFGLQYLMMEYLSGYVVTQEKIDIAEKRFKLNGGFDYFPKERWEYILKAHDGKLPISIRAVPEGTIVPTRGVMFTVVNTDPECAWLVPYIESILLKVWKPSSVATYGLNIQEMLRDKAYISGEEVPLCMDNDFGYRGASTEEEAQICGAAHLLNSRGSDTCVGEDLLIDYYGANPGWLLSVRATEHHTMQTREKENEQEAYENIIDLTPPEAILSIVTDTWDYEYAQEVMLGKELHDKILARAGKVVFRPDSGDPVEVAVKSLEQIRDAFGYTINKNGFIINNPKVGLLMGDQINADMMEKVLNAIMLKGYGISNLCFGMGGARYSLTRDTYGFTTKECAFCQNGVWHDTCKTPKGSEFKKSVGGRLKLVVDENTGKLVTRTYEEPGEDIMVEVFRDGNITKKWTFEEILKNATMYK